MIIEKKKKIFVFVSTMVLLGSGLVFSIRGFEEDKSRDVSSPLVSREQTARDAPALTPSPEPFLEMTIPYLRKRIYSSKLGELEQVGQTSTYTSYLTSYDSDGLEINGLLTEPKGGMPEDGWPGIVFVHGYIPPEQYKTLTRYQDYVDYLARNGFVVFKIDLRGHGESEGCSCGAYNAPDYVIDTLNAYRALQNSDFVNSKKVGLWGHSMAGNIVFRSLVVEKTIPAVVIWAGAVYTYEDFQKYSIQDDSYQPPPATSEKVERRQKLFETHGEFDPQDSFWRKVVPTNYLENVTGAMQVHHAQNDNVVSIEYSLNLINVLEGTSVQSELFEYQTGGHNITGPAFNQAMARTVEFYANRLTSE